MTKGELELRGREDCRGRQQRAGRPLDQDPLVRRDTEGRVFEFFTFHLNTYTTAHCSGILINCFSGTCVNEVLTASITSIFVELFLNKNALIGR